MTNASAAHIADIRTAVNGSLTDATEMVGHVNESPAGSNTEPDRALTDAFDDFKTAAGGLIGVLVVMAAERGIRHLLQKRRSR